jgi:hypothetical protein
MIWQGEYCPNYEEAAAENEALRHDLERQMSIANEHVNEVERLREALADLLHAVCGEKGFAEAVRRDSGRIYPWPALELAEAKARAILDQSK